jgi:hypothetical protein
MRRGSLPVRDPRHEQEVQMNRKRRAARLGSAVAIGLGVILAGTGPASAGDHAPKVSAPLAQGLAGPLQIDVGRDGKVLVGQGFSGTVSTVDRKGNVTDVFNEPGAEGVEYGRQWGSVVYTSTVAPPPGEAPPPGFVPSSTLKMRTLKGEVKVIADLLAYETANNPDGGNEYGIFGLSDDCAAQIPPEAPLLPYSGIVESHPYAVTDVNGGWVIADAAANAIFFVSTKGDIKTVAVLPPQEPVVITAEAATANQLPECVVGAEYVAEPVPTDVEVGPGGLYVSTLPGGPEDPSLGARGGVYKVNPWNGKVKQVASGFAGATNLAVTPWGAIYVSELFGGQISKVVGDHGVPVVQVPEPAALEWAHGKLYAGIGAFSNGQIVTIKV